MVNSPHLRSKGLLSKNKSDYVNRRRRLEGSKWQRFRLEPTGDFQEASKEIMDAIRMLQGRRDSRSAVERVACVAKKFRVATVRNYWTGRIRGELLHRRKSEQRKSHNVGE